MLPYEATLETVDILQMAGCVKSVQDSAYLSPKGD